MAVRAQTAPALISLPERKASAGLWSNAWFRLRRDRLTMIAAVTVIVMILLSLGAPLIAAYVFQTSFERQDLLRTYGAPTLDPPA